MDMMTYLRLKSVLGDNSDESNQSASNEPDDVSDEGDFTPDDNQPSPIAPPSKIDIGSRMAQLYQPKSTASTAYSDMLSSEPDRSNFAPSPLRKTLATIAGIGAGAGPIGITHGQPVGFRGNAGAAFNTASAINDQPYDQALEDFNNKLKPMGVAAAQEEKDNINNRIAANNVVAREISNERAETAAKENERKVANDASLAKRREDLTQIQQAKEKALEFADSYKQFKSFTGKDGFIYFIKPGDTHAIKSDIQSNKLSDFDKFRIRHDNTLSEIFARGDVARGNEDTRQTNRKELEDIKQRNRQTNITTPRPAVTKPDTQDITETVIDPGGNVRTVTHTKTSPNSLAAQPGDKSLPKDGVDKNPIPTGDANRQKAIDYLTQNKKPVTEANIAYIMTQMGVK